MKLPLLAIASSLAIASAASAETAAMVGDFAVSVAGDARQCVLELKRGEMTASFTLPIPAPCALHADEGGAPRTISRDDGTFLLVESSKPTEGSKDCDTQIQALRIDQYGADLAPHVEKVAACAPFAWDEAVFLSMFPLP